MTAALKYYLDFAVVTCCTCATPFAMLASLDRRRYEDQKDFYCPNGHAQKYTGQTEAQRLRKELDAERQRKLDALTRANEATERAAKLEREAARKRKRAHAGLCSCCNRTFANLARHMKTKHGGES